MITVKKTRKGASLKIGGTLQEVVAEWTAIGMEIADKYRKESTTPKKAFETIIAAAYKSAMAILAEEADEEGNHAQ